MALVRWFWLGHRMVSRMPWGVQAGLWSPSSLASTFSAVMVDWEPCTVVWLDVDGSQAAYVGFDLAGDLPKGPALQVSSHP